MLFKEAISLTKLKLSKQYTHLLLRVYDTLTIPLTIPFASFVTFVLS